MDPNANLAELRRLVAERLAAADRNEPGSPVATRMAELVEALDGWLSRGGFLPDAWKVNR